MLKLIKRNDQKDTMLIIFIKDIMTMLRIITETNKENEEHNDSAGEDFDHNFDFTVSLDDEYINNIEKKEMNINIYHKKQLK